MGISYYSCRKCGETIADCGDHVDCDCGESWCSYGCADADGYMDTHCKKGFELNGDECDNEEQCKKGYDEGCEECEFFEEESTCNYCRKEDYEDYDLLDTALNLLDMSREKLIKLHKEREEINNVKSN